MPTNNVSTPKAFANTWTAGFAKAVRAAAGKDGRISLSEAEKVAPQFADNVKDYLQHVGQKSVSVDKLIAAGHDYAFATADKAAGKDGKLSIVDARSLPVDLAGDFTALRAGGSTSAKLPVSTLQSITRDFENLDYVGNMDDRVSTETKSYTRAKNVDDVKTAVEKSLTGDGFWNIDHWDDSGKTGQAAIDGFIGNTIDGITSLAGEDGDETKPIQDIADRLTAALKSGTYKSAQLLTVDIYGPQIADTRSVLVLTGNDGKLASISADNVDF